MTRVLEFAPFGEGEDRPAKLWSDETFDFRVTPKMKP